MSDESSGCVKSWPPQSRSYQLRHKYHQVIHLFHATAASHCDGHCISWTASSLHTGAAFLLALVRQRNAAKYVSESVRGAASTASKEAGKGVANDSDAKLGARAAGDMVGDKVDQETHNASPLPHISTLSWAHTNSFFLAAKGGRPQGACQALDHAFAYLRSSLDPQKL
jgi:hypothetical protein